MKLIPVIDLMNARVVMAKGGQRHAYAPSDTPLCRSSRPQEVVSAFLNLFPFDTLYIADLDAICAKGSNLQLMQTLSRDNPDITFWIDNGLTEIERLSEFACPVIGSESLTDSNQLCHLIASLPSPILSLDYLDQGFNGPVDLDRQMECWPDDIIVMTLSRVGTSSGPDTARLQELSQGQPKRRFHAAGGIRNLQDLQLLRSIGTAGVLLSTALHQMTIDGKEIDSFTNAC